MYVQISLLMCARGGLRLMGGTVLDHPPPYSLSRSVLRLTGLLRNAPSLPLESWDYKWATIPPGIYVLGIRAQVLTFAQKMLHPRSPLPNLPLRLLREDAQMDQESYLISDIFFTVSRKQFVQSRAISVTRSPLEILVPGPTLTFQRGSGGWRPG